MRELLFCILLISSSSLIAQENPEKLYLWEKGAPGFEDRKDEPELAQDWWVRNIHNRGCFEIPTFQRRKFSLH